MFACQADPPRSPAQTVVVPAAAVEAEPTSEAPPRGAPPAPRDDAPSADDRARAESFFREARQLMSQGNYPDACRLFAESLRYERALGTLLNLATCAERMGDTGGACTHFAEARDLAHDKGDSTRERFASDRLSRLGCP